MSVSKIKNISDRLMKLQEEVSHWERCEMETGSYGQRLCLFKRSDARHDCTYFACKNVREALPPIIALRMQTMAELLNVTFKLIRQDIEQEIAALLSQVTIKEGK